MDKTRPTDWKYVSEGGATIVFSYVGPPNPSYDGMVLRLRKATTDADDGSTSDVTTMDEEPDDPIIEYQTRCIERLVPRQYLPRLESVALERWWLEQLAKVHHGQRPGYRIGKDHIDLKRRKGVLATDLVGGNWTAVEIKVCSSIPFLTQSNIPLAKMGIPALANSLVERNQVDQDSDLSVLHA
jgi:inositol-pentakisphosphate 2-kinase